MNPAPLHGDGEHVLYWMIAARRAGHNFALQRAVVLAQQLRKPLVVLEALRIGYPWASDRLHRFVIDGMAENRRRFEGRGVLYYPYIEPASGEGSGLLEALAETACAVVTDDFPAFFLPQMVAAAGAKLGVRLEKVDGHGLLPLRASDRDYPTANAFRRHLQRALPPRLSEAPLADPLSDAGLPPPPSLRHTITFRWPAATRDELEDVAALLARLRIDHSVAPVPYAGGSRAAVERLHRWLGKGLPRYGQGRDDPDDDAASGLSPWLRFGHLSVHQVFDEIARHEGWSFDDLADRPTGKKDGWWGMGESAEAFLDELVIWRELGANVCAFRDDYDRYESLPAWARETLAAHARDPRPDLYSAAELERAQTHDPVWNAAQRQLLTEGRIHNYLRMLWGKNVLAWSRSPREALDVLIELNNKHAVDGRDPNSYSGIFWCFGRHDRPWPERPIFGKVRTMTSTSTRRKLRMDDYLRRWAPEA